MPRYYGQWNPPVDKVLHEAYFADKTDGVAIECGASDGIRISSCLFFERNYDWNVINVEPAPFLYNKLCMNRPHCVNINAALSNKNGSTTFKQPIHPRLGKHFGNGSISHTRQHLDKLKNTQKCKFEEYIVKTITFASLVENQQAYDIDLLVLDVEGHEPAAIEGMKDTVALPRVVCVEYTRNKQLIKNRLDELGYVLDFKKHNNAYFIKC